MMIRARYYPNEERSERPSKPRKERDTLQMTKKDYKTAAEAED